jgi:energy-coupling factor transporter transmembrane protein EcfT
VQRLRQYMPILVAMIISALRTADKLGLALQARALGYSGARRTSYRDITFRPADWVYLAIILACFSAALYARFGLGVGVDLVNPLP